MTSKVGNGKKIDVSQNLNLLLSAAPNLQLLHHVALPARRRGLLLHDHSQRKAPRSVNTNRYINLFAAGRDLHFTNEIL